MDYYQKIKERDVWVEVLKPLVWSEEEKKYIESQNYCSAFNFKQPAKLIAGEFIRDSTTENDMKWFDTADEAANAAFEAAKNAIVEN